jgi:transposase
MHEQLYWLSDAEWKRLQLLLPSGRRGAYRVDNRQVISGIVHIYGQDATFGLLTSNILDSVSPTSCCRHKRHSRMRDRIRGEKMRAQRSTWKVVGAGRRRSSIEQLQLDLAAVNRCIDVLEKAGANPQDIEVLTAHALTIAERIDEERWLNPAEALGWLFENANTQGR